MYCYKIYLSYNFFCIYLIYVEIGGVFMENFIFYNPTKIIFGKGVINQIGSEISKIGRKVLLLYGKGSIKENGVYDSVCQSLKDNYISYIEVSNIKPNPVVSKVREAIKVAREENVEAIIAIGGGSVIDTAKAVAVGFYHEGDIWDFILNNTNTTSKALPIITVLTISATSSEMNRGSVILNEENNMKIAFYSENTFPVISFIDPEAQYSLPQIQLAYGAVDIITHVLELYFDGTKNTEFQDYFAESIIKTVIKNTEKLLLNQRDYEARAQFVWMGTLALNGLNAAGRNFGDWATHRIGHAISAIYDTAHGETLSIVLPAWMRYCLKVDIHKFARFGSEIFSIKATDPEEVGIKGILALKDWFKKIGVSTSLVDSGIRIYDIPKIAINPSIRYPVGKLKILEQADVENILRLTNY
jgi:alcohol dehydrogenase